MINPILFISALGPKKIYSIVYETDKCSISWKITNVKVEKNNLCSDNLIILVKWKYDYYVSSSKTIANLCDGWAGYSRYNNSTLPQTLD